MKYSGHHLRKRFFHANIYDILYIWPLYNISWQISKIHFYDVLWFYDSGGGAAIIYRVKSQQRNEIKLSTVEDRIIKQPNTWVLILNTSSIYFKKLQLRYQLFAKGLWNNQATHHEKNFSGKNLWHLWHFMTKCMPKFMTKSIFMTFYN